MMCEILVVCEGFATGASLHEATGYPAIASRPATCCQWHKVYGLSIQTCR